MAIKSKPRIIYNDDTCTLRTARPPHTLDSIKYALDYLKGSQVDWLCWCIGEQLAYSWPSKVIENAYDLLDKQVRTAADWDTNRDIMYALHKQGIDYLPHMIECARAQDLGFIASFRMNDTHIKSYPDSSLAPEFWKTHQHMRIWDATDAKSYYNAALDYSFPEVRNRYRDAIMEVADWYDVDGIELDFTRSPYFFAPCEAWDKRAILTKFVKDVGQRLEAKGKERGRPFILVLRIASLPRALKMAGVDLEQWIKQGLAPVVAISTLSNEFNYGIEPWRTLGREHNVLVYPAVEAGPMFHVTDFETPYVRNPLAPRHDGSGGVKFPDDADLGMQRAMAQNLLAQDPDGIYMFNFPCRLAEGANIIHDDKSRFSLATSVLSEMGNLKTLAGKHKHYTFYSDLPIYVESNRPRECHQTVPMMLRGKDIAKGEVTIRWRQIAERNPHADEVFNQNPIVKPGWMKVYLNDKEIPEADLQKTKQPAGRITSGFKIGRHELVELTIPGKKLVDGENTLAFEVPRFPTPRDPYVYIYDVSVDVRF